MPVMVSVLAIDIGAVLNDPNLTAGNIVGFLVRYLILFIIGGVVAYLHDDEQKPIKLFQLGLGAPALITSLITAQGVAHVGTDGSAHASVGVTWMRTANAAEVAVPRPIVVAGGFFSDVFRGLSGGVYSDMNKSVQKPLPPPTPAPDEKQVKDPAPVSPAPVAPALETKPLAEIATEPAADAQRLKKELDASRARTEALEKAYRDATSPVRPLDMPSPR
ncbi:MAG: hypothetical protein H6981_00615 [Gammaproteobacteria bacterium]|nr:hypothetical protein [Gammaproteobacteria bacterium]MCP5135289.1 hypothetical protein [Gammaproteobacteria bacterium]